MRWQWSHSDLSICAVSVKALWHGFLLFDSTDEEDVEEKVSIIKHFYLFPLRRVGLRLVLMYIQSKEYNNIYRWS